MPLASEMKNRGIKGCLKMTSFCEVLFTRLVFVALFKKGALGCADVGGKSSQLSVYYNNTKSFHRVLNDLKEIIVLCQKSYGNTI